MYKLDKFLKPDALPSMDDTLNLYSGNPADDLQFEEGDIPMLRPQEEDTMQAPQEAATMSVQAPMPVAQEAATPPMSDHEKLIQEYKKLSEQSKEELNSARERDDNSKYIDRMLQAGAMANKALASQGGYNVDVAKPISVESDFAKRVKDDAASRLKSLVEQSKLAKNKSSDITPLDQARIDKIKQEMDISKQKQSQSELKDKKEITDEISSMDQSISKFDEARAMLKNEDDLTGVMGGGLTRFFDALNLSKKAPERQNKRLLLNSLGVDSALLKVAKTKGSISDKEMALFQSDVPSIFDDEKVWVSWIDRAKKVAEKIKNKSSKDVADIEGTSTDKKEPKKKDMVGKVVVVKGKRFKVAEDGDSLIPLE